MSAAIDNVFVTLYRMPEPERELVTYKLLDVIDELCAANEAACDEATKKGLTGRAAWRVFQRQFTGVFKQHQQRSNSGKQTYAKLHVSRERRSVLAGEDRADVVVRRAGPVVSTRARSK